jgi:hypothetical protein
MKIPLENDMIIGGIINESLMHRYEGKENAPKSAFT